MTQHQKDFYNHVDEDFNDYYEHRYRKPTIKRSSAIVFGAVLLTAALVGAFRLWVAFQGNR